MTLLLMSFRNLARRPARSLLTIVGLGLAMATMVSLVGLADTLERSFLDLYRYQGADLVVQRRGGMVQISKGLPLELARRIEQFPETSQIIPGLMDMVSFEDHGLFMVIANGWEIDSPVLKRIRVLSGRRLRETDQHGVMLGKILAANLGKEVGQNVDLYGKPFEVVGIFESTSVFENGAVFFVMATLQREIDRPGQATGFVVQANPPGDPHAIERLRGKIEALDADVAATPCAQFVHQINQIQVTRTMSRIVSSIAAIIGIVGIFNTISMTVAERSSEIGTLRALGWRLSRIIRLLWLESLVLGVVSGIVGAGLGFLVLNRLSSWKVTAGLVAGNWMPWHIGLQGILLTTLIVTFGAVFATWRLARKSPVELMRGLL